MSERQPIPVTEIVLALEREADGYGDARWLAASHLRRMSGWETRTLMCRIDTRPATCEFSDTGAHECKHCDEGAALETSPARNSHGGFIPECSVCGEPGCPDHM